MRLTNLWPRIRRQQEERPAAANPVPAEPANLPVRTPGMFAAAFIRQREQAAALAAYRLAVAVDATMYEDTLHAHTVAQARAKEAYPATVERFGTILQGIKTGQASWRPPACDAEPLLTAEDVEATDPKLHGALARISLALCLPTLLASAGDSSGLELFDAAWTEPEGEDGAATERPDWLTLLVRIQERRSQTSLPHLVAQVGFAVETRTWGDDQLISDVAHAISVEVSRLPAIEVTACLVAALQEA